MGVSINVLMWLICSGARPFLNRLLKTLRVSVVAVTFVLVISFYILLKIFGIPGIVNMLIELMLQMWLKCSVLTKTSRITANTINKV